MQNYEMYRAVDFRKTWISDISNKGSLHEAQSLEHSS